ARNPRATPLSPSRADGSESPRPGTRGWLRMEPIARTGRCGSILVAFLEQGASHAPPCFQPLGGVAQSAAFLGRGDSRPVPRLKGTEAWLKSWPSKLTPPLVVSRPHVAAGNTSEGCSNGHRGFKGHA